MYHRGIHVKEEEFSPVREIAKKAAAEKLPIIFLPCHKSHIDYLVISYIFFRLGIALPHIAAGDNLNMFAIGDLLRSSGAFFIRREWGSDTIYGSIVREYMEVSYCPFYLGRLIRQVLMERGHNIEAFIEGGRSRMGKLLQPKFGILKIVLNAVLSGRIKDAYIVPMSIGYDKVIETSSYVSELLGTPKEKESLSQLLSNLNLLNVSSFNYSIDY